MEDAVQCGPEPVTAGKTAHRLNRSFFSTRLRRFCLRGGSRFSPPPPAGFLHCGFDSRPPPSVLLRQGDALCIHRAATAFDEYAFPRGARKALPAMSCRTITPENFDLDTPPPPPGRSMCVPLLLLPEWLEKHGYEATAYDPRLGFILRPSASTSSSDHAD